MLANNVSYLMWLVVNRWHNLINNLDDLPHNTDRVLVKYEWAEKYDYVYQTDYFNGKHWANDHNYIGGEVVAWKIIEE